MIEVQQPHWLTQRVRDKYYCLVSCSMTAWQCDSMTAWQPAQRDVMLQTTSQVRCDVTEHSFLLILVTRAVMNVAYNKCVQMLVWHVSKCQVRLIVVSTFCIRGLFQTSTIQHMSPSDAVMRRSWLRPSWHRTPGPSPLFLRSRKFAEGKKLSKLEEKCQ